MREREEKNPNLLALQMWEWRREVRRKGAAAPQIPSVRAPDRWGAQIWAEPEYLGQAGKIFGQAPLVARTSARISGSGRKNIQPNPPCLGATNSTFFQLFNPFKVLTLPQSTKTF
jgi:hypothetical protein